MNLGHCILFFQGVCYFTCLLPFLYTNLVSSEEIPLILCYVHKASVLLEGYILELQQTQ